MTFSNLMIKKLVDEKTELRRKIMMSDRESSKTVYIMSMITRCITIDEKLKS